MTFAKFFAPGFLRLPWLALLLALAVTAAALSEDRESASLSGRLLVAAPELVDPNFGRTVVYLVEHNDEGAMGLVVNRPLGDLDVEKFFANLDLDGDGLSGTLRAHSGGPVEPSIVFILHSAESALDSSRPLPGGLSLTNDPEMLRRLAAGEGPKRHLLLFGYAGWAPGQLEGEIAGGFWNDIEAADDLLFELDDSAKWNSARERLSIDL